jgi:hypothetical protein
MRVASAICVVTALSMSAPLLAQTTAPAPPPVSTRIEPPRSIYQARPAYPTYVIYGSTAPNVSGTQYRQALDYGRCVSNVSPSLAADVLAMEGPTAYSRQRTRQLAGVSKGCLPAGTMAPLATLRAALAETYYRQHGGLGSAVPQLDTPRTVRLIDSSLIARMASCLVRRTPATVDVLLNSEPGSKRERDARDAAFGAAPTCSGGFEAADVSVGALRTYVALEAYERLKAGD